MKALGKMLKTSIIFSGLFLSEADAEAGRLLEKSRRMHKQDHSGHNHSKFYLGVGISAGIPLSSAKSEEAEAAGHDDHDEHDESEGGLRLGAEHDHGSHGGGSEGGSSDGSVTPTISIRGGYRLLENTALTAELSAALNGTLEDPAVGLESTFKQSKRVSLVATTSASIPLSEASSKAGKLTTLRAGFGPRYKKGKWTVTATAQVSYTMYNDQAHTDEEPAARRPFALQDDHDHAGETHSDAASAQNTVDDHDHDEHDHDDHEIEAMETLRTGGNLGFNYAISKSLNVGSAATVSMVNHNPSKTTYATSIELAKVGYSWRDLSLGAGIALAGEAESFAMPGNSSVVLTAEYLFE